VNQGIKVPKGVIENVKKNAKKKVANIAQHVLKNVKRHSTVAPSTTKPTGKAALAPIVKQAVERAIKTIPLINLIKSISKVIEQNSIKGIFPDKAKRKKIWIAILNIKRHPNLTAKKEGRFL